MKILYFLLLNFLLAQNIYAQNPIASPTFDDILKDIVKNDKYVFDNENIVSNVIENNIKAENKDINVEDEITINFDTRTVIKDGKEIMLKRKEFDILSYLYKHKGVVLTRQQLLNEVWGYEDYGDTRTVDVHIRRLRANLGDDKEKPIVETVFGVGYVVR